MNNPEPKKSIVASLFQSPKNNKTFLPRGWLVLASVFFISLLLGVAIFAIGQGVFIAIPSMAYWKPTRTWLIKWLGLRITEPPRQRTSLLYRIFISIFQSILFLTHIIIGAYIIKFGIDILLRTGFLSQNFIYLLFFR